LTDVAAVYNSRTSSDWPGSWAITATWFPDEEFTYALFYGCEQDTAENIFKRISGGKDARAHPLLLPGILAELERRRQIALVMEWLAKLNQKVNSLGKRATAYETIFPAKGADGAIDPWVKVHYLKNGLENWRDQVEKMITHVDELDRDYFAARTPASDVADEPRSPVATASTMSDDSGERMVVSPDEAEKRKAVMRRTGARIKDRLKEIIAEYDEHIRECVLIMQGMTLATQLAHTKTNMDIALETKRDGSQMKSIALLTMIFLPATFVATLFSMSFFNWNPDAGAAAAAPSPSITPDPSDPSSDAAAIPSMPPDRPSVSHWIWIYFVISIVLTLVTVTTYLWWTRRNDKRYDGYSNIVDGHAPAAGEDAGENGEQQLRGIARLSQRAQNVGARTTAALRGLLRLERPVPVKDGICLPESPESSAMERV
jgi:hypothetical protein